MATMSLFGLIEQDQRNRLQLQADLEAQARQQAAEYEAQMAELQRQAAEQQALANTAAPTTVQQAPAGPPPIRDVLRNNGLDDTTYNSLSTYERQKAVTGVLDSMDKRGLLTYKTPEEKQAIYKQVYKNYNADADSVIEKALVYGAVWETLSSLLTKGFLTQLRESRMLVG